MILVEFISLIMLRYSDLHVASINKFEKVKVSKKYMSKEYKGMKYHIS